MHHTQLIYSHTRWASLQMLKMYNIIMHM